jgi:hypothetical protein
LQRHDGCNHNAGHARVAPDARVRAAVWKRTMKTRIPPLVPVVVLVSACWSLDYGVELKHRGPTALAVGDSIQLTAELYADGPGFPLGPGHERVYTSEERPGRFRWVSSDSLVLRIQPQGVAHALAPGEATVTAQVGDLVSRGVKVTVR